MESNIEFIAHKFELGFVGNIAFAENLSSQSSKGAEGIGTIVIIDRSGSMYDTFSLLLNTILPKAFEKLHYSDTTKIDVITFDDVAEHHSCTCKELYSLALLSRGGTTMAPAIQKASSLIETRSIRNYRILVLSDGGLGDTEPTAAAGAQLASLIRKGNYMINSQAVRLFTSSSQPDTRGMASLLQLNTTNMPQIVNISAQTDVTDFANQIAALFEQDGMNTLIKLISSKTVIKED